MIGHRNHRAIVECAMRARIEVLRTGVRITAIKITNDEAKMCALAMPGTYARSYRKVIAGKYSICTIPLRVIDAP